MASGSSANRFQLGSSLKKERVEGLHRIAASRLAQAETIGLFAWLVQHFESFHQSPPVTDALAGRCITPQAKQLDSYQKNTCSIIALARSGPCGGISMGTMTAAITHHPEASSIESSCVNLCYFATDLRPAGPKARIQR